MSNYYPDIIVKKRDGHELQKDDIRFFVDGVTTGSMQDCQIGAMLMAIFIKDMTLEETKHLTECMIKSGEELLWPSEWDGLVVDKHSTGGVGDKISLVLAPALAACGLKVPMISGRGLQYTGGTLDKLESIPGYKVQQDKESIRKILDTVGCCIVGQTDSLVPADKKMYSIRDVTGTVNSIPLITGSIMSKKCAERLSALVLDVKTGRGAVLPEQSTARQLAMQMSELGNGLGVKTTAVLTNMDRPTGYKIGNALEVIETLECLRGQGPASTRELVEIEGGILLRNTGKAASIEEGSEIIARTLRDGSAMKKFCQLLKAQGVSEQNANKLCEDGSDVYAVLPKAKYQTELPALKTGYVADLDALACAKVNFWLGAGRPKTNEPVNHAVGLDLHNELGDAIREGEAWVTIHHNKDLPSSYITTLQDALVISPEPLDNVNKSLIIDII